MKDEKGKGMTDRDRRMLRTENMQWSRQKSSARSGKKKESRRKNKDDMVQPPLLLL